MSDTQDRAKWQVPTWLSNRRWITGIAVAVIALAGVIAIRWFVFGGIGMAPEPERSIEASWVDTIEKLGIEPRYPPEEDFVVGDLLALVTKDDENAGSENKIADPRTASFLRRAVKLAHIDVNQALSEEYRLLPVFPDIPESGALASQAANSIAPVVRPAPRMPTRDFSKGVRLKDLPLASFPRLRIQGTTSAGGGLSGAGFWAIFGASNTQVEELELGEVRTYGLSSIYAAKLLKKYCSDEKTKNNCTEETAREHLRPVTKDRSILKFIVDASGNERYAMTVEVVMVYRVYVTRSIKNLRQASRVQQGGGHLTVGSEEEDTAPAADESDSQALAHRVDVLEHQLAKVRKANAAVAEEVYNRESSFNGTFERPVAIGFRGIRVNFDSQNPNNQQAQQ